MLQDMGIFSQFPLSIQHTLLLLVVPQGQKRAPLAPTLKLLSYSEFSAPVTASFLSASTGPRYFDSNQGLTDLPSCHFPSRDACGLSSSNHFKQSHWLRHSSNNWMQSSCSDSDQHPVPWQTASPNTLETKWSFGGRVVNCVLVPMDRIHVSMCHLQTIQEEL